MKYRATKHFYGVSWDGKSFYVPFAEYVDARISGEANDLAIKKDTDDSLIIVIMYRGRACAIDCKRFKNHFKAYGRN